MKEKHYSRFYKHLRGYKRLVRTIQGNKFNRSNKMNKRDEKRKLPFRRNKFLIGLYLSIKSNL